MKNQTRIVIAVSVALLLVVGVFAYLNRGNVAEKRAIQASGSFNILADGQTYACGMDTVQALNPQPIQANYKKSGKSPVEKTYTGVSLKSIFDKLGIDYSAAQSAAFTAVDGYASALPIADALDEANCYIVIEEGGQPLGTRESGGSGPFMMILARDQFSQRWCKFLMEVALS